MLHFLDKLGRSKSNFRLKFLTLAAALIAVFAIGTGPVLAQAALAAIASQGAVEATDTGDSAAVASELGPLSANDRAALVGHLTDSQSRDLLLYYLSENAPAAQAVTGVDPLSIEALQIKGEQIRDSLVKVFGAMGTALPIYGNLMEDRLDITIGGGGMMKVIGYLLGLSLAGGIAEFLFRYLTRDMMARVEATPVNSVRQQLARALVQLAHNLGAVALFAAGYAAAFLALWGGHQERRDFVIIVLLSILLTRVSVALVRFVFLPNHTSWRIMPCDDEAAAHFVRGTRRQVILGMILLMICTLGSMWGVDQDAWRLSVLGSGILFALSFSLFLWRYRRHLQRAVAAVIDDDTMPRWAESAAGWTWYVFAVGYVIAAFLFGIVALLLGRPFSPLDGLIGFFILFVVNPYLTAVLTGVLVKDRAPLAPEALVVPVDPDDGPADSDEATEQALAVAAAEQEAEAIAEFNTMAAGDQRVLRRVISLTVLIVSLLSFSALVGINAFSSTQEYPVAQFAIRMLLNVGVIALLSYVVWAFIAGYIDRKLVEEKEKLPDQEEDHGEGPPSNSGTRIQTILPIVRTFTQATIAVVAVMVLLSSLGVNIAPLLAGAGVIGLAIGFGAQTLVKDLISGLFFLLDDAFRIGEFIECGDVAGSVEKFNARSLVLRGYLGAVYTVPYGDLGKITNYSRDWVIMKLRFRVPYDTDIDLVRKIFKKIGQEMLEDEELGPNFIQPFKSQGVIKMDDSAFVVSGKFMTKPNKQWGVRKAVYQKVQEEFRNYGIKFAPKRVIVDIPRPEDADDDDHKDASPAKGAAVAAAAAAAVATGS